MTQFELHQGDCLEVMKTLPDNSVDSIVTDPPYGISFMGKKWDYDVPGVDVWAEALRLLKPGGHILVACGTRTQHRMVVNIEDAGFEIRDTVAWIYGSGFPKSLDVSKQLDLMVKNEWLNISKAFDNVAENEIINLWKRDSKTVKFVELSSLKNVIVIGIATPKNDSVQSNVQPKTNPERLPLDVIIAELNLSEALPTQTGRDSIVPESAGAITTLSHSLVITAESLLENPNVKPCLINSIAQCGVRASQNGSTAETIKDDEALRIWLGKSKSLTSQDVNALSAGMIDGLKLTILNHSKTFQNLDTISQTACVSAITVTITESTAASLISFTADTLKAKAIDKAAGAEREVVGMHANPAGNKAGGSALNMSAQGMPATATITAPASDDAKQWSGWGTALKPAMELWTLARKPLIGTVAQNVLEWGTGAINIDGCRVPHDELCRMMAPSQANIEAPSEKCKQAGRREATLELKPSGRWPANLIHDGSDEVLAHFPNTTSGKVTSDKDAYGKDSIFLNGVSNQHNQHGDAGSAARFFYCAKASKSDRNGGLDGFPVDRPDSRTAIGMGTFEEKGVQPQQNHHPTVKPTALMQYLCRLITPPGGTVLDPYTGSGSTGKAAMFEDFRFIGIERELEYVEIATARIEAARTREPLFLEADSQKTQGRLF